MTTRECVTALLFTICLAFFPIKVQKFPLEAEKYHQLFDTKKWELKWLHMLPSFVRCEQYLETAYSALTSVVLSSLQFLEIVIGHNIEETTQG